MSMENHGGMISTDENSWLVDEGFLEILPVESSDNKQEECANKVMNLALRSIFVRTSHETSHDMGPMALLPFRRKSC
jgi:hypothetical protein